MQPDFPETITILDNSLFNLMNIVVHHHHHNNNIPFILVKSIFARELHT